MPDKRNVFHDRNGVVIGIAKELIHIGEMSMAMMMKTQADRYSKFHSCAANEITDNSRRRRTCHGKAYKWQRDAKETRLRNKNKSKFLVAPSTSRAIEKKYHFEN